MVLKIPFTAPEINREATKKKAAFYRFSDWRLCACWWPFVLGYDWGSLFLLWLVRDLRTVQCCWHILGVGPFGLGMTHWERSLALERCLFLPITSACDLFVLQMPISSSRPACERRALWQVLCCFLRPRTSPSLVYMVCPEQRLCMWDFCCVRRCDMQGSSEGPGQVAAAHRNSFPGLQNQRSWSKICKFAPTSKGSSWFVILASRVPGEGQPSRLAYGIKFCGILDLDISLPSFPATALHGHAIIPALCSKSMGPHALNSVPVVPLPERFFSFTGIFPCPRNPRSDLRGSSFCEVFHNLYHST